MPRLSLGYCLVATALPTDIVAEACIKMLIPYNIYLYDFMVNAKNDHAGIPHACVVCTGVPYLFFCSLYARVQYIVEALQLQTWRKGGGIPVSDEEAIDFSGVQYVFDVNGFEKFIEVVDAENTISGCVGHSAYRLRVRKLWQCVTLS